MDDMIADIGMEYDLEVWRLAPTAGGVEFIAMFYLTYVIFLFAGHNNLSIATGVDCWGAAQPGAALDFGAAHGHRGGGSRGGGSRGGGGSHGVGGSQGGGVQDDGEEEEEGAPHGGGQHQQVNYMLVEL
jgi:hypothetical protein